MERLARVPGDEAGAGRHQAASQPGPGHSVADHVIGEVCSLSADTTCGVVDELFRSTPSLGCIAVTDRREGRVGLVMRGWFQQVMVGTYGYGRALWSRRPIADLADWRPLVVPAAMPVLQASRQLRQRPDAHRYDDLLVDLGGGRLGRVSAAAMFDALAQRLAGQAIQDGLTGVANRAYFLEQLTAACSGAGRRHDEGGELLVAFVDLDGMKPINDTYGHRVGDRLLIVVARSLVAAAGHAATVARLGGDEFAVLSPVPPGACRERAGHEFGERLRRAVSRSDPDLPPGVSGRASVGVAVDGLPADPEALLTAADLAMYRAKQRGGDAVVVDTRIGWPRPSGHGPPVPVEGMRRSRYR